MNNSPEKDDKTKENQQINFLQRKTSSYDFKNIFNHYQCHRHAKQSQQSTTNSENFQFADFHSGCITVKDQYSVHSV